MPPPPAALATRALLALLAAFALLLPAPAADTPDPAPAAPAIPAPPFPALVPPAPAGLILDQAHVLLPEAVARLGARLVAARAADVHVYLVTIRSLGVPASKQSERLSERAKEYSDAWLRHKVGGVVLFDDQGGLMTVELSKETNRLFTSFAVEAKIKDALDNTHQTGLAREKLEFTGQVVVEILSRLQSDYAKETRRQRTANLIMGTIALVGVGLAIFSAFIKSKGSFVAAPKAGVPPKSPLDF